MKLVSHEAGAADKSDAKPVFRPGRRHGAEGSEAWCRADHAA